MAKRGYMTVDKGSVTVNGVSLTVCNPTDDTFQVAIIPYTYEHTNFHTFQSGSIVNIEFDQQYLAGALIIFFASSHQCFPRSTVSLTVNLECF